MFRRLVFLFSLIQFRLVYSCFTFMVCWLCCFFGLVDQTIGVFFLCDSLAKFVSKCVFWNFWTCLCAVMRIYCNLLLCQNFLINYVLLIFFYFECICDFFEAGPEWGLLNQTKKTKQLYLWIWKQVSSVEVHIKISRPTSSVIRCEIRNYLLEFNILVTF